MITRISRFTHQLFFSNTLIDCIHVIDDYSFDQVNSKTDSPVYDQYDTGHSTKLDTDAGYAVWRPVIQRDIF